MTQNSMMQRWVDLFPSVSLDTSLYWYHWVKDHYDAPNRHFHSFGHIEYLLLVAEEYFDFVPRTVQIATWLHDIVYEPGSSCNEVDSAMIARAILPDLGVARADIELIAQMIECTKDHVPNSWQAAMLCDLDLCSLASLPDVYRDNSEKIKQEFAAFAGSQQGMGRNAFIDRFLSRERIFSTELFYKIFEEQARENLITERETW